VGADEALTYFLSWYEKVDLETLRSMREGSVWTTDPEFIWRRQELAHRYVDFADTEAFVRDIREPEKKDDAEDAKGSDSSQDEEEAEAADPEAPEQVLPRPEVMALFLLLDPTLLKPTSLLPQLHLPAALPPLLPLELCSTKNFKLYQIPGMPGAVVIYNLFPFGFLPEQVLIWFACL
jgi:hypothetical protein